LQFIFASGLFKSLGAQTCKMRPFFAGRPPIEGVSGARGPSRCSPPVAPARSQKGFKTRRFSFVFPRFRVSASENAQKNPSISGSESGLIKALALTLGKIFSAPRLQVGRRASRSDQLESRRPPRQAERPRRTKQLRISFRTAASEQIWNITSSLSIETFGESEGTPDLIDIPVRYRASRPADALMGLERLYNGLGPRPCRGSCNGI
jgi:hypothetical protein